MGLGEAGNDFSVDPSVMGPAVDPSLFLNQSLPGIPDTGTLASQMGIGSLADFGNVGSDWSVDPVAAAAAGGGGLKSILGGLGSTLGALGPGLAAAGKIALAALNQPGDRLWHPVIQAGHFAPYSGNAVARGEPPPNLGGQIAAPPDPMTAYATLVRSMR